MKFLGSETRHDNAVSTISIGNNNGRVMTGSSGCVAIKFWDPHLGLIRSVTNFVGVEPRSYAVGAVTVQMSEKSSFALDEPASSKAGLRMWNSDLGQPVKSFPTEVGIAQIGVKVMPIAISADGLVGASSEGVSDFSLNVWALDKGELSYKFSEHQANLWLVDLNQNGTLAISAAYDGSVKVWDVLQRKLIYTFDEHTVGEGLTHLSVNMGLILSRYMEKIILFNLDKGKILRAILNSSRRYVPRERWIAVSSDGTKAAASSGKGNIEIWDLTNGEQSHRIPIDFLVHSLSIDYTGSLVVAGSENSRAIVWESKKGQVVANFRLDSPCTACTISQDGSYIIAGDQHGYVYSFNI
jgi:WD40 repeat protein